MCSNPVCLKFLSYLGKNFQEPKVYQIVLMLGFAKCLTARKRWKCDIFCNSVTHSLWELLDSRIDNLCSQPDQHQLFTAGSQCTKASKKNSKKKNWKETVLSLSSRRRFLQLYFLSTEHLHTITTYYHYWLSLFSKMSSTVIWTWHLGSSYLLCFWWEMWKVLLHNMLKWNGTRLRISWFSSFTALRDT